MNVYKLSLNQYEEPQILNKDRFEAQTQKRYPYYQLNKGNTMSVYAVCPGCNNPIEIIGMIERQGENNRLYARHYPHSIVNLAIYNQEDYNTCGYRARQHYNRNERKPIGSPIPSLFLEILKEQFDRVIYLIKQNTGIKISVNLARSMLERFIANWGHTYIGANLTNIPWIFAYLSDSQSLFGQYLDKNNPYTHNILEALKENVNIRIVDTQYGYQISGRENHFLRLFFCFHSHRAIPSQEHGIEESIIFSISEPNDEFDFTNPHNPLNNILWEHRIDFDHSYFNNLIQSSRNEINRDKRLLLLAEELL